MNAKLGYWLWALVLPLFASTIAVSYYYSTYFLVPLSAAIFCLIAGAYLVANGK